MEELMISANQIDDSCPIGNFVIDGHSLSYTKGQ